MPEVTSREHPNLQVLRADPHQSWTLWPRSCVTLRGAPAPSGWSRAPSLQPLCLPGRRGLNQWEQGSCCSAKTAWSPRPGSGVGRQAPGVQRSGPRGVGERGREAGILLRFIVGRERARVGPRPQSGGGCPQGATGREPSRGWVGAKPREGLHPSAWSPLEGPRKQADSRLVFGLSLTAV